MDLTNTAFKGEDSAHWYTKDGVPCHTVVGKNGNERPTTLRDARKLGLLPSVTSILSYLANPALDSWKQRQVLMSALTLKRNALETEDQFAARIIDDSKRQASEAAAWGTKFHAIAHGINTGNHCFPADQMQGWALAYDEWYGANIVRTIAAETVLVDTEVGYAGTCDLIAEHQEYGLVFADYKRQDVKNGKASFYSKWLYQLAAYRHAYKMDGVCLSIVVDCNSPTLHVKVWDDDEVQRGWGVFSALTKVWKAEKGYDPCIE
jgi:hypothetical protein